jgi:hypothetical protein
MVDASPAVEAVQASIYLVAVKMAFALLGFSALVTEVATLVARHRFAAGNFFSYFTVEANTLWPRGGPVGGWTSSAGQSRCT